MDSKLVVEQMSGNWKIKHPDMKPLAMEANRLAPFGHDVHLGAARAEQARRPAGQRGARRRAVRRHLPPRRARTRATPDDADSLVEEVESPARAGGRSQEEVAGYRGWSPPGGPVTTLVLVRHGATAHTADKRFSGGLASSNPGLTDEGRAQVREVAEWLAPLRRGRRRRRHLAGTPHPRVRRDPRRARSASTWSRSRASPRWSSAPGTG